MSTGRRIALAAGIVLVLVAMIGAMVRYYRLNYVGGKYRPLMGAILSDDFGRVKNFSQIYPVSVYHFDVAIRHHRRDILRFFVEESGVDVNQRGIGGETALMYAVENLDSEAVRYLLDAGADPNIENNLGETALVIATRQRKRYFSRMTAFFETRLAIVNALIAAGANVAFDDNQALSQAILQGDLALSKTLLRAGGDPNQSDSDSGLTPFIFVNSVDMARLLIQHGADVNGTNNTKRQSPLQWALEHRTQTQLIEFLVAKGANPFHRDADGLSTLDYAAQNESNSVEMKRSLCRAVRAKGACEEDSATGDGSILATCCI